MGGLDLSGVVGRTNDGVGAGGNPAPNFGMDRLIIYSCLSRQDAHVVIVILDLYHLAGCGGGLVSCICPMDSPDREIVLERKCDVGVNMLFYRPLCWLLTSC